MRREFLNSLNKWLAISSTYWLANFGELVVFDQFLWVVGRYFCKTETLAASYRQYSGWSDAPNDVFLWEPRSNFPTFIAQIVITQRQLYVLGNKYGNIWKFQYTLDARIKKKILSAINDKKRVSIFSINWNNLWTWGQWIWCTYPTGKII